MRPQFSLLAILLLTAYAAMLAAAVADAESLWMEVCMYVPFIAILLCCNVAAFSRGNRRWFAVGTIAGSLAYIGATAALHGTIPLPHEMIVEAIWTKYVTNESFGASVSLMRYGLLLLASHISLACGGLGGCLALWCYRRHERRNALHAETLTTC